MATPLKVKASANQKDEEAAAYEYVKNRVYGIRGLPQGALLDQGAPQDKPERKYPDSWQMNFWNKYFSWLLFNPDSTISRIIQFVFVTPLTNVTGLSLYYQLYLNEIFHTTFVARLGHFTFMPVIDFFIIAFFAQFQPQWLMEFFHATPYPPTHDTNPFAFNIGVVVAVWWIVWYLLWGFLQQTKLFGVWMFGPIAALTLGANTWYTQFRWTDGQEHPWYEPTPWYVNPLVWMLLAGAGQSASHAREPKLPPRVNGTAHWIDINVFIAQHLQTGRYLDLLLRFGGAFIFGIMDEIIASPRLLPLQVLKIMHMLGYNEEQAKQIKQLARWSMAYGDPALDFIGTGGALRPPATYEEAKERLRAVSSKLSEKEREEALHIVVCDEERLLKDNKYETMVEYKLLYKVITDMKLMKYGYGALCDSSNVGENLAKNYENKRVGNNNNAAFNAFLYQARKNIKDMQLARQNTEANLAASLKKGR